MVRSGVSRDVQEPPSPGAAVGAEQGFVRGTAMVLFLENQSRTVCLFCWLAAKGNEKDVIGSMKLAASAQARGVT